MAKRKTQFERLEEQVAEGEVSSKTLLFAMGEQLEALAKVIEDDDVIPNVGVREQAVGTLRKIGSFIHLHAFVHSNDTWKIDATMREQAHQLFQGDGALD